MLFIKKNFIFLWLALTMILPLKSHAGEQLALPQLQILSWSPRIFLIENFLSSEECDHIIAQAKPELKRSTVVGPDYAEGIVHQGRTSFGMFFPKNSTDAIIRNIEKRIAALTMLPEENGEGLQVLLYGPGAEYQPHYDYFDPSVEGERLCYIRGGQRIATCILYLNSPEEGGETIFPKAKISVRPIKGNAILFYNCTPDGVEDPLSFHGGAPVKKGEKWIATKWIRKGIFK